MATTGVASLRVGPVGTGSAFQNIRIVSTVVTPAAVSLSVASQALTCLGIIATSDNVIMISQPVQSSKNVTATMAMAGPSNDQVTIFYSAQSGTAATPNPGTYTFLVFRNEKVT